ncbi:hypothetical protein HK103_001012 [Boothiomyces macroporosus]|uniref:Uncharacterized protein n=1 Tax=Boothiomyces macroporosus TaxID=261099 RepID=A0AAD5UF54_9FUNG|nr:hypothetical protein HK103_001012 [Boothiomyces macroporosus]
MKFAAAATLVSMALASTKPNNVHHLSRPHNSASLQNAAAPAGAKLTYYGGPVISNVKVFTIFWGGQSNVQYASQINQFYTGVTNSALFDMLAQYDTPTQNIGRGSFIGSYDYTGAATGTLDDSTIQTTLKSLISSGKVPAADSNTYYAIHFAPGVSITQGGSSSCVEFCAYHNTIQNGSGYIYYGIIPDQGGSCAGGCGSDSNPFNNLCSVSSHELIEATTDPAVGLATGNSAPLAWYDSNNGEIGDICNAQQGTIVGGDGNTYVVQAEFSNKDNACIVPTSSGPNPPPVTTTTAVVKPTTPPSTCAHDKCVTGTKLKASCDPCVSQIISQDSYCGSTKWDSICVGEVNSICGITC